MQYSFSDRVKNLQSNAIRAIFKVLDDPDMISFAGGFPATDCLRNDRIREITDEILSSENAATVLQYGGTEGLKSFRETGIEYLKRVGISDITLDNIIAISGGQQAIDLMCKCFLNKGDCILVEDPTYLAVLHILKTYEAKAYGIRSGDNGIDVDDMREKIRKYHPKFIYLVPNFSNPTGRTLDILKRKKIAEICAEEKVVLLEDDPYRELRYSGQSLPAISAFDDGKGACAYATSFSKTCSPGLRVGLIVGAGELIGKLTIAKQAVDVHTSNLSQAIVEQYIKKGYLDRGVSESIPEYREKRDAMISALEKYMPKTFQFTRPDGGLFIWGEFTDGTNTREKFQQAIESKVVYVCGSDFFADGSGENTLRLNFSNSSLENIDSGVQRLAKLFS